MNGIPAAKKSSAAPQRKNAPKYAQGAHFGNFKPQPPHTKKAVFRETRRKTAEKREEKTEKKIDKPFPYQYNNLLSVPIWGKGKLSPLTNPVYHMGRKSQVLND